MDVICLMVTCSDDRSDPEDISKDLASETGSGLPLPMGKEIGWIGEQMDKKLHFVSIMENQF